MNANNPAVIPRNNMIERLIGSRDIGQIEEFMAINPYSEARAKYTNPGKCNGKYVTHCGT